MSEHVEAAGSAPGAMVAEQSPDAPNREDPEEYTTARGCLTLLLILIALTAISVLAVVLGGDPAPIGGS